MSGTLREHVSHACVLTQGALDRLQQPTVVAGQRVSALRFGDPRVMALSQAITGFTHLPRGFRNRDLRRSEEHTSELQSPYDLVCRLLLEKKNLYTECLIQLTKLGYDATTFNYILKHNQQISIQ